MPRLNFRQLSRYTLSPLTKLTLRADETHLIASPPDWLADAVFSPVSITYGIFAGETAVGIISLIDPRVIEDDKEHFQEDCLYVWRVMIDQNHRAQGFGTQAITFAKDYAQLIGLKGVSLTTMDRAAGNALPLYETLGFTPTGRRLDDEIELVWRSA